MITGLFFVVACLCAAIMGVGASLMKAGIIFKSRRYVLWDNLLPILWIVAVFGGQFLIRLEGGWLSTTASVVLNILLNLAVSFVVMFFAACMVFLFLSLRKKS